MTAILGISAFYHDSAAALVLDGQVVAAAQEERFSRIKHDARFPEQAVQYCLREAGLGVRDLDFVGFYEKPLLKFDRILETYLSYAPLGLRSFLQAMPIWVRRKLHLPREIHRQLGGEFQKRIVFAEHHESHAASAFFPSPFEEAAILTIDGVGEWATTSFGTGRTNQLSLSHEIRFPHSLGLLYSAFTYYCGFRVNSGEYKLMGLAPYGTPRYANLICEKLVDIRPDGSFRLDLSYFNYCQGLTMTSRKFARLFGRAPRKPESPIEILDMDLAASIQQVTEDIMLAAARHVHRETKLQNLCLAGGVALNCVGNGRIVREGPFEQVWIQPAAGDAGGALGVALLIWYQLLQQPRAPRQGDAQAGSLLGPRFSSSECQFALERSSIDPTTYQKFSDPDKLCDEVARLLADGHVIGLFQGRMEFGPRALGGRSILGDPRAAEMQRLMNRKIKFRESFRPFAPSVLKHCAHEYFELAPAEESPYMLLTANVAPHHRCDVSNSDATGFDQLDLVRSTVPAVTHVDFSARIQTVDPERHGIYYRILERFYQRTGCPVLINTSFNVRGEPIVASPSDAVRCFLNTQIDHLVLENLLVTKSEQLPADTSAARQYRDSFALD